MFKKVELDKKWPEIEEEILKFWKEEKIFEKSVEQRKDSDRFIFYEGPPTANGKPGIHHVLARIFKDVICRFKTIEGYYVPRIAGWDTHGLPVELEVEKNLGINGKKEIEKYGIQKFVEECKKSVFQYKKEWDELTERIGYWVSLDRPYMTCSNDYIESLWWALSEIHKKGLLFKDYKIVPYCPRCETTLSSHEVAQGYQEDTPDPSVFVKFPLLDEDNTYFIVWTTTPWTLTANVALAVNANADYVKVDYKGEKYILAKDRLNDVLGDESFTILETFKGSSLVGKKYAPPFNFFSVTDNAYFVIEAPFVGLEEGSGIVHIAPAFGAEDMEVSKTNNLPILISINTDGTFKDFVTPFKGLFIKDADKLIIENLKNTGLLLKSGTIKHTYPFCWRCNTPLIYMAKNSWFIKVSSIREELMANNELINWIPEHIKYGRFGSWLSETKDWAISRERYWGTPLNVWTCNSCGEMEVIESIAELKKRAVKDFEYVELHRPYIDEIELTCTKCGSVMKREKEVLDCWFDSGSMPFAQFHYPFSNTEEFLKSFPADFISEGIDHTRGWFYVLLVVNTILFGKPAFKNALSLELILDEKGEKMSKSRGNVVDPSTVINTYGVDSLRWSFYFSSTPYVPRRFNMNVISDALRNFIIPLLNSTSFFVMYANIDNYEPVFQFKPSSTLDRWIISKINSLTLNVKKYLDMYYVTEASKEIMKFIDDLTNWYIRRSRRRFWKSENDSTKLEAYNTLFLILYNLSIIIAPFTPFVAEYIYSILKSGFKEELPESVHLLDYPEVKMDLIDTELEKKMNLTRDVVTAGLRARKTSKVKVRFPLNTVYIFKKDEIDLDSEFIALITEELNVKNIEIISDLKGYATLNIKPNLTQIGKKYGNKIPNIVEAIKNLPDTFKIKETIDKEGSIKLNIDGEELNFIKDDFVFELNGKNNLILSEEGSSIILLDTTLNDELIEEGIAREFSHFVQNLRKEYGFDVADRIYIYLSFDTPKFDKLIKDFKDYILKETLTKDILPLQGVNNDKVKEEVFDFNYGKIRIALEKV